MALIGHLDLIRLFDRVMRRGSLPISFTGGYHPSPRISIAHALALGATSNGEIVDFELKREMSPEEFHQALTNHLPPELPVYRVEEVELKSPSANVLLVAAEYLVTVATSCVVNPDQWQNWVQAIMDSEEIIWVKTTKSRKQVEVNLRSRLFTLSLESLPTSPTDTVILRYTGSCHHDGNILAPQNLIYMLEQVTKLDFSLLKIHRLNLELN
jgi:radical SAM-linked protein